MLGKLKKASIWMIAGVVTILAVLMAGLFGAARQEKEQFETLIATACTVTAYGYANDGAWLEIIIEEGDKRGSEITVKTTDSKLMEELAERNVTEINGVQLALKIPEKVLEHSDYSFEGKMDIYGLMCDSEYQAYFTLTMVYWKETPSTEERAEGDLYIDAITELYSGIVVPQESWIVNNEFDMGYMSDILQLVLAESNPAYKEAYEIPEEVNFYYNPGFNGEEVCLYFPFDSGYMGKASEWEQDCICELNVKTGEYRLVAFEKAKDLDMRDNFLVRNGFIYINGDYPYPDAEKVWNGKNTSQLSGEEKDAYGTSVRTYLLTHPGEMVEVSNRYEGWTEAYIDLTGDGKTEDIIIEEREGQYYSYDGYNLRTGDLVEKRYSSCLNNEIWAFSLEGERIFIALYEDGPSGDPLTTIFKYDDGMLVEAGEIGCDIRDFKTADGMIHATERWGVIQTDSVYVMYGVDEVGNISLIPQEAYEFGWQNDITLKEELVLHRTPGSEDTLTIKPQIVHFIKVNAERNWIYLEAADGKAGWFEIKNHSTLADGRKTDEVFDGLSHAG